MTTGHSPGDDPHVLLTGTGVAVDVISWAVALVAGLALPSLGRAIALGVATSISIRLYQYFIADPRAWGTGFPEDLFGAAAMLAVTTLLAWIGSIIRMRRAQAQVTS